MVPRFVSNPRPLDQRTGPIAPMDEEQARFWQLRRQRKSEEPQP